MARAREDDLLVVGAGGGLRCRLRRAVVAPRHGHVLLVGQHVPHVPRDVERHVEGGRTLVGGDHLAGTDLRIDVGHEDVEVRHRLVILTPRLVGIGRAGRGLEYLGVDAEALELALRRAVEFAEVEVAACLAVLEFNLCAVQNGHHAVVEAVAQNSELHRDAAANIKSGGRHVQLDVDAAVDRACVVFVEHVAAKGGRERDRGRVDHRDVHHELGRLVKLLVGHVLVAHLCRDLGFAGVAEDVGDALAGGDAPDELLLHHGSVLPEAQLGVRLVAVLKVEVADGGIGDADGEGLLHAHGHRGRVGAAARGHGGVVHRDVGDPRRNVGGVDVERLAGPGADDVVHRVVVGVAHLDLEAEVAAGVAVLQLDLGGAGGSPVAVVDEGGGGVAVVVLRCDVGEVGGHLVGRIDEHVCLVGKALLERVGEVEVDRDLVAFLVGGVALVKNGGDCLRRAHVHLDGVDGRLRAALVHDVELGLVRGPRFGGRHVAARHHKLAACAGVKTGHRVVGAAAGVVPVHGVRAVADFADGVLNLDREVGDDVAGHVEVFIVVDGRDHVERAAVVVDAHGVRRDRAREERARLCREGGLVNGELDSLEGVLVGPVRVEVEQTARLGGEGAALVHRHRDEPLGVFVGAFAVEGDADVLPGIGSLVVLHLGNERDREGIVVGPGLGELEVDGRNGDRVVGRRLNLVGADVDGHAGRRRLHHADRAPREVGEQRAGRVVHIRWRGGHEDLGGGAHLVGRAPDAEGNLLVAGLDADRGHLARHAVLEDVVGAVHHLGDGGILHPHVQNLRSLAAARDGDGGHGGDGGGGASGDAAPHRLVVCCSRIEVRRADVDACEAEVIVAHVAVCSVGRDHVRMIDAGAEALVAEEELQLVCVLVCDSAVDCGEVVPEVAVEHVVRLAVPCAVKAHRLAKAVGAHELERHCQIAALHDVGADELREESVVRLLQLLDLGESALATDPQTHLRHTVGVGNRVVGAHMLERPRVAVLVFARRRLGGIDVAAAAVDDADLELHLFAGHQRLVQVGVCALHRLRVRVDLDGANVARRLRRARQSARERGKRHRQDAKRFLCLHVAASFR